MINKLIPYETSSKLSIKAFEFRIKMSHYPIFNKKALVWRANTKLNMKLYLFQLYFNPHYRGEKNYSDGVRISFLLHYLMYSGKHWIRLNEEQNPI